MMFALVQSLGRFRGGIEDMTVNGPMSDIVFVHELYPLVH